jgi:hypothetical protein
MSTPKTAKKAPSAPADQDTDLSTPQTALGKRERLFLNRIARFVVNIQSHLYIGRATRNGYTTEEHAEGWRLWSIAAGMDRSLDHWFTEQQLAASFGALAADRLRILQEIDAFENLWFPRVRAIIRRMVPRDSRDVFAAAFFANLEQQPLGPTVVGSVRTLLQRIRGLEGSSEPGAKDVYKTLVQRGLTATKVKEIEALLKEAEVGSAQPAKKKAPVTAAEIAAAQAAQREAYEDLRDWFNDIGTQLRPAFNVREQIHLGLVVRRARGGAEEITEDLGDELDEEAGDPAEGAPAEEEAAPAKPKGK